MGVLPPLIGITTYGPETGAAGGLPVHSLPQAYSDAVAAAGGMPVLLGAGSAPVDALLSRLDALVISGGGDIAPERHRGGGHETVYMVNAARDAFELALAECALAREDLPLLGVCRGMQVLNIALGGDLELHLPDVYGEAVVHRLPPREPTYHKVRVDPESALGRIYEVAELRVCSWHHQCVRELGRGLVAAAWSEDGVVEGVVHATRPWTIGIQWHPEMQVRDDPLQRRLFDALVEGARRA